MKPTDNQTEQTLTVTDRMEKLHASDALKERLYRIPSDFVSTYHHVPKKIIWSVAASITLLIAFNIIAVSSYSKRQQTTGASNSVENYFDHLNTL